MSTVFRLTMLAGVLLFPAVAHAQRAQFELNQNAAARLKTVEATLETVYKQVETKYRVDSVSLRKLRVAQAAWVAFRDAQMEATFPAVDAQRAYGSGYPMCVATLREALTRQRIAQLRQALHPAEGEVCAGGPP